jgi:RNA polymerase sigma-70 factor (ECF subfamily)
MFTVVGGEADMEDLDQAVDAARAGDGSAFEQIWRAQAGAVAGYLRARGVPDADDVTSDVFLVAFDRIGEFVGDGSAFRSWLFTIAHNRLIDSYRKRDRDLSRPGSEVPNPPQASAEDTVLHDQVLFEVLMRLPLPQREVVWLRVVLDLSVAEVCQITGRRPSAVKQLQRRGLDRLRRHLNGPTSGSPITPIALATFTGMR